MRPTIYIASFMLSAAPLAAQSTKPDTTPPSPGSMCAEREGRCDDGAVKGKDRDDCVREPGRPCADPPPMRTACLDEDRDGKCDPPSPGKRGKRALAGIGGVLTSVWVNNVPKEKGGGRDDRKGGTSQPPNVP